MSRITDHRGRFFLLTILVLCFSCNPLIAKDPRESTYVRKFDKDWSFYNREEVNAYQLQREYEEKNSNIFALQQAKKAIINGNLNLAKFFLTKINTKRSDLGPVKSRYLSLIHFINGEYSESYKLISDVTFNRTDYYKQICLLRVINLIALDDIYQFRKELSSCQNITFNYSQNDQFWLRQVSSIKERDKDLLRGNLIENYRNTFGTIENITIWLKMALFLNKEEVIAKYVGSLPSSSFRSKKVRELIGFAYYRLGKVKKAQEFIEDIESPNADNIRGNIMLSEGKFELAFGHFKLALQKKENSQNALQRGLPLSYLLGLWDEGLSMLNRVVDNKLDVRKKNALKAVFYIRKEDFKRSRELLNILDDQFKKKVPFEVNLMDSYVALREFDEARLELSSGEACRKYDGLSCWLNMQTLQWENIGKTLSRDEATFTIANFDIDSLKSKADIAPLREPIFIDQKDIEELDSELIQVQ